MALKIYNIVIALTDFVFSVISIMSPKEEKSIIALLVFLIILGVVL